jgi:hypothetical protein
LLEKLGGIARRRRLVIVARGVKPGHRVVVNDAAVLVFGDLDEPNPDLAAQLPLGDPGQAGELAGQVDDEPAPQFGGERIEQDVPGVVVAIRAYRGAQPRVVLAVVAGAGQVAAVWAAPLVGVAAGPARQATATAAGADGVHRAEPGCGQGGEDARMRGDRFRDALAAGQPGPDDLPGVALVDV